VKLASSTSPQKPPATYTLIRGSMIFRGRLIRESDLYASIYGMLFFVIHSKVMFMARVTYCYELTVVACEGCGKLYLLAVVSFTTM